MNGATLTSDKKGEVNKAYSFNGTTNYISFPSGTQTNLNILNDFTVSYWIKTDKSQATLLNFGDNVNSPYPGYFSGINGGNVGSGKLGVSTNGKWYSSNSSVNNNQWRFVSYVLNSTNLSIYIDGKLENTILNVSPPISWSGNRILGSRSDLYLDNYNYFGNADDIAIYNRALTQEEITALYLGCTKPTVAITPKSTTNIKENESVVLAATKGNGYTYAWYKDGVAIANATDSNYTANLPGVYTVKVTSAACDSTSAGVTVKRAYALPNYLPTNGLVGWWPFNGNANDESGNGNHGTVNGATLTSDKNGEINSAYKFTNPTDVINIDNNVNNNTLDLTDEMSFSFWINSKDVNAHQVIMNKANSGVSDSWIVQLSPGSSLANKIWLNCGGLPLIEQLSTASVTANDTWYHIGIVYNLNDVKFYINGNHTNTYSPLTSKTPSNENMITFGRDSDVSNSSSFKGDLDDIAIYNRALTQEEITALSRGKEKVTLTQSACTSYIFGSDTLTASGTYTRTTLDTLYTLNLTINNVTTKTENVTTCGSYTWPANGQSYAQSGTYTTKLVNAAGCDSIITLNLTISEVTATITTSSPTTVCQGTIVPLNATTGNDFTYVWKKNNLVIAGATNATYSAATTGYYEVEISNSNGCKKVSEKTLVKMNPLPFAGSIAGKNYVCKGESIQLVASIPGGVWSSLKPNLASVDQNGNVTGLMRTARFTSEVVGYTLTNQLGCSATAKRGIGIDSLPVQPIIAGPNAICTEGTALFRVTNTAGVNWTAGPFITASSAYQGIFTHRISSNGSVPNDNFETFVKATAYSLNKVCTSVTTRAVKLRLARSKSIVMSAPSSLVMNATTPVSVSLQSGLTVTPSSRFWISSATSDLTVVQTTATSTTVKALRIPTALPKLYYNAVETSTGCGMSAYKQFTVMAAASLVAANTTQTVSTNGVHIYPNPSNGRFTIENSEEATEIKLVDITGRIIATHEITAGKTTVDFSGVTTGKYMVHITGESINEIQPIVIE